MATQKSSDAFPSKEDDEGSLSTDEGQGEKKKTKLCRHFARGYCRYGAACSFAHGEPELRFDIHRSPFYKTEVSSLCRPPTPPVRAHVGRWAAVPVLAE